MASVVLLCVGGRVECFLVRGDGYGNAFIPRPELNRYDDVRVTEDFGRLYHILTSHAMESMKRGKGR